MAKVGERIYARLVMAGQRIAGLARIYVFRFAVKKIILCAWFAQRARRIGDGLGDYVASLIGVGAALLCVLVIPDAQIGRIVDRMNELHFACAGLIGTIFTLVLTLSVIPAQRAAEAFSPGVLGLYRDNITIKTVSLYLAAAAIGSAFLGLGWTFGLSPRYTLGFQFVILGTALDAVRWLYRRILDLFNPMVAAELLRRKIEGDIKQFDRYVKRFASLAHMTQIGPLQATRDNLIRSLLYQRSGRARDHIRSSIDHLLELGIRAIKRQDSYGAREALNAMAGVAVTYMDLRRTSLVLMPNIDLPLSLQGTSGLEEVLVPIYEAVKSVNDEAARQGDERVVQGAVMALGKVSRYAMTVISKGNNGVNRAPLVYFSVDTLGACVESAWRKGMTEAAWDTVGHLAELLKGRQAKVHTWEADTKAVEILRNIALWDYLSRPNPVVGVRAVEALLDAALHDLQLRDGAKGHFFDVVIEAIDMVVGPAAKISAFSFDLFPAYSEMRQASMQGLVQFAASRVKPANSSKAWIDPFKSFDEVAKRVQMHFRKLAKENDFGSALFLKLVLRSLSECTAAVIDLSASPSQGSEHWIDSAEEPAFSARGLIHPRSSRFRQERCRKNQKWRVGPTSD